MPSSLYPSGAFSHSHARDPLSPESSPRNVTFGPLASCPHGSASLPPLTYVLSASHLLASLSSSTAPTQPMGPSLLPGPCEYPTSPAWGNTRPVHPAIRLPSGPHPSHWATPQNWVDKFRSKCMFSDLNLSLRSGPQAWGSLPGWPPTPRQFMPPSAPTTRPCPPPWLSRDPAPYFLEKTGATSRAHVPSTTPKPA